LTTTAVDELDDVVDAPGAPALHALSKTTAVVVPIRASRSTVRERMRNSLMCQ